MILSLRKEMLCINQGKMLYLFNILAFMMVKHRILEHNEQLSLVKHTYSCNSYKLVMWMASSSPCR